MPPPGGGVPRQVQPPAQLSPLQELHRQAYYQAIQSGYNPHQARAHADAVVQQHRTQGGQTPRAPQAPGAYHAPTPQQHLVREQQRVAQQQQMAAAQQNERLWQALQQQRGVPRAAMASGGRPNAVASQSVPRQSMGAALNPPPPTRGIREREVAPIPAQGSDQTASPAYGISDAEVRNVKSASSQLARLHTAEQRNTTAGPPARPLPAPELLAPELLAPTLPAPEMPAPEIPAPEMRSPEMLSPGLRKVAGDSRPPQVPARLAVRGISGETAMAPLPGRSVLEPAAPAVKPAPAIQPTGPLELPAPATGPTSTVPGARPSARQVGEPSVAPLRSPRKLPAVDPQPLQQPQREFEIQLEGFTEGQRQEDSPNLAADGTVTPVSYQQPAGFQSYANQQYLPQLDRPAGTSVVEPPGQLVSPAAARPTAVLPARPVAGGFQVEAVPEDDRQWLGLELPSQVPNEDWQDASSVAPTVPHPAGQRVTRSNSSANPLPAAAANYIRPRRTAQDLPRVGGDSLQETLPPARSGLANRLPFPADDDGESGPFLKSCEDLRKELLGVTLRDISLDLSTPASTLTASDDVYPIRDWRDPQNRVLARGRAVSATTTEVRIVDEAGNESTLLLSQLAAKDQKQAWDVMDLPFECSLSVDQYYCRSFAPTHVSWHASNLCHKPLYFEDIQLERYGHTVGPIRQPVKSAIRFLGQAALLPYQMSLSPPNECEYPLGLFRPGNCAPYLRTPFPWERRAVGYQAGVTAGLFLLVP